MSVFECVYLRGNLFRRIGRQDGAFCLKDNRSFVVMFVYVMDRNKIGRASCRERV